MVTAFRTVRREVGFLTTSFFKKAPGDNDAAEETLSLLTMRIESDPGLTV